MSQGILPEDRKNELFVALSGMLGRDIARHKANQIESLVRARLTGGSRKLAFKYLAELSNLGSAADEPASAADTIEI